MGIHEIFERYWCSCNPCLLNVSAMRFAHFVLGFETLAPAVSSRRLIGICDIMLSGKRMLRQAAMLSVNQVLGLHKSLANQSLHIMDRAIVSYLLFSLYGRCRCSDLLSIHAMQSDFDENGGYVLIETCNHKSGRLATLKTRLLPILIPVRGVDGAVWAGVALDVLKSAGVCLENPIDGPLMPASWLLFEERLEAV